MPEVETIVDATHAGRCPPCGQDFQEGDEVIWRDSWRSRFGGYFVHVRCAPNPAVGPNLEAFG